MRHLMRVASMHICFLLGQHLPSTGVGASAGASSIGSVRWVIVCCTAAERKHHGRYGAVQ